MTLLSVAAFARTHGVSKAAAQKWQAKGYLTLREGRVDVERSDMTLQHADLGRFSRAATGSQNERQPATETGQPATAPATSSAPPPDLDDPDTVKTLNDFVERFLGGHVANIADAEAVKASALAMKQVLAARRDAGRLIDLETAEKVVFELARSNRDTWANFPSRAGPMIAAELGVESDRVVEVLSAHVHQQLTDLGEPEPGFLGDRAAEAGVAEGDDASAADQHPGMGGPVQEARQGRRKHEGEMADLDG